MAPYEVPAGPAAPVPSSQHLALGTGPGAADGPSLRYHHWPKSTAASTVSVYLAP